MAPGRFRAEIIKDRRSQDQRRRDEKQLSKEREGKRLPCIYEQGKRSVCADRHSQKGQEIIARLIETADVVCDSFPAGELERCDLDYDRMKERNPRIIYASQTGFGKTGPMNNTAGNDLTAEALCGLMQITGYPEDKPTAHGSRMADQFGGVFLAFAIISALMARETTGEGQKIDISSADCMFTALEDSVVEAAMSGKRFEREGNRSRSIAPYDTFEVKDGIVSTAVSTNGQWKKFCEAMDMEELLDDPRYATNESRGENYDTSLRKIIADKFKDMTKWEIEALLRPYNIPSGPGYTVPEAFDSEQLSARNMVVEVEDKALGTVKMPGFPIKISGADDVPAGSAPLLGEDTEELLRAVGYDSGEIAAMAEEGIIMCGGGDGK